MAAPDFYSVTPDCIQHGLSGGLYASEEVMKPFQKCFDEGGGFFTFGPGRLWDADGKVIHDATAGLYTLTAIGLAVSIAFIIAWVWFEHRKLMAQAERLKAAGRYGASRAPTAG